MSSAFKTFTSTLLGLAVLTSCSTSEEKADRSKAPSEQPSATSAGVDSTPSAIAPTASPTSARARAKGSDAPTSASRRSARSSQAAPTAALPKTKPGPIDRGRATTLVSTVVGQSVAPVPSDRSLQKVFDPVATGDFLAELKARRSELQTNGWTEQGGVEVVSVKVTPRSNGKATVTACLDQSEVRVIDANGKRLPASSVPRAQHIYDLTQRSDKSWRITAHRFPNDPTC
ncbi:IMS domain-containing protein [Demetria terragena]|uniref:IMS domain-containing protein n=1 Tax=Demetria terragena TaxID=63959 RepID=UPI0003674D4A|nr:IMS domain-containing protein [Demetria terragena]